MQGISTKVAGSTIGSAVTALFLWTLETTAAVNIQEFPSAALTVVVTFLLGYVVPEKRLAKHDRSTYPNTTNNTNTEDNK